MCKTSFTRKGILESSNNKKQIGGIYNKDNKTIFKIQEATLPNFKTSTNSKWKPILEYW